MLVVPPYLFDEFKAAGKTGILDRCLERVRKSPPPSIFPIRFPAVRTHSGHWLHWTDGEMNRCNGTAAYERDGELAVKSHATPLACQASLIAELRFVRFNHSAC